MSGRDRAVAPPTRFARTAEYPVPTPHASSGAVPLLFTVPASPFSRLVPRTARASRRTGAARTPVYAPRHGALQDTTGANIPERAWTGTPHTEALPTAPAPFLASATRQRSTTVAPESIPCSWVLAPFGPLVPARPPRAAPDTEPESVPEPSDGHAVFRPIAAMEPSLPPELSDGHAVFRPIATHAPQIQSYDSSEAVRAKHAPEQIETAPQWGIPPGILSPQEEASS
ncbi:hypothetical protein ACWEQ8_30155 [Streptomyces noursei]